MKKLKSLPATTLIVLAGLIFTGCYGGPGEARYVNRTNSTETLTLNRDRNVKTKLISTFHGVSIGSYTMKTANETMRGVFTGDGAGFKFSSEHGKTETIKFSPDGSFEYQQVTWEPRTPVDGKVFRIVLAPKELKAVQ